MNTREEIRKFMSLLSIAEVQMLQREVMTDTWNDKSILLGIMTGALALRSILCCMTLHKL